MCEQGPFITVSNDIAEPIDIESQILLFDGYDCKKFKRNKVYTTYKGHCINDAGTLSYPYAGTYWLECTDTGNLTKKEDRKIYKCSKGEFTINEKNQATFIQGDTRMLDALITTYPLYKEVADSLWIPPAGIRRGTIGSLSEGIEPMSKSEYRSEYKLSRDDIITQRLQELGSTTPVFNINGNTLKKEPKAMKIEKVTMINNERSSSYSVDQIIYMMETEKKSIDRLNDLNLNSKAIEKLFKKHEKNIEELEKVLAELIDKATD